MLGMSRLDTVRIDLRSQFLVNPCGVFFVLLSRDSIGTYHKVKAEVNPEARGAEALVASDNGGQGS